MGEPPPPPPRPALIWRLVVKGHKRCYTLSTPMAKGTSLLATHL